MMMIIMAMCVFTCPMLLCFEEEPRKSIIIITITYMYNNVESSIVILLPSVWMEMSWNEIQCETLYPKNGYIFAFFLSCIFSSCRKGIWESKEIFFWLTSWWALPLPIICWVTKGIYIFLSASFLERYAEICFAFSSPKKTVFYSFFVLRYAIWAVAQGEMMTQ